MYAVVANNMIFGPFDSIMAAIEYALLYWTGIVVSDDPNVLADYADRGMAIVVQLRKPIDNGGTP